MKTIRYKTPILFTLLSVLLFAASCEVQENFEYQASGVDGELDVSAWEYIQQSDSLSLLHDAIIYADLKEIYTVGSDSRTYIIPNDKAFRNYLQENGYTSVEDIPKPILRNMLKYHVVNAHVIFTDPELSPSNKPIPYETENGQLMYLSHATNYIGIINQGTNQQWQIRTSNLEALNGVLHIVNDIVYFSAPTGDTDLPNPDLVLDTIYPIHDAYVNGGGQSTANFGTNPLLKVKNVSDDGDYDRKAFLMFDLDDFSKEGVVTDMRFQISVSFTHAKGVDLDLYETPSTDWSESSLNFNNAVFPTKPRIATLTTTKVSAFNFDITDHFKSRPEAGGRISLMLDGEAGSDETDDLASKEHSSLAPPMLIATLASGNSQLEIVTQNDISIENGGVSIVDNDILELKGAAAMDIIYTIESAPTNGWLIKGASTLTAGSKFTQLDIELMNLLFIHDGENSGQDELIVTARDRAGAILEDIKINIHVQ